MSIEVGDIVSVPGLNNYEGMVTKITKRIVWVKIRAHWGGFHHAKSYRTFKQRLSDVIKKGVEP